MARARMIARNITKSKKIAQLTDAQRVMYAFILPFLDREGRINAHPTYLKGMVFLHLEYTEQEIEAATQKMHDVGLVTLYATEDDVVMEFKDFLLYNKPNVREAASEFPAPVGETAFPTTETPPTDKVRARSVQGPCVVSGEVEVEREKEVEVEVENNPPPQNRESEQPQVARTATADKKEKKSGGRRSTSSRASCATGTNRNPTSCSWSS